VCLSLTTDFGHTYLLGLVDSKLRKADDGLMKMVTLYQPPSVTALKLFARAQLVNGTYPKYPEIEFVQVTIGNPNNIDMQIIPVL